MTSIQQSAPAPLDPTVDLKHSISQVTVYEDRADVVRVANVELAAGAHVLRFVGLSPLIDEDRLVARLEADVGGSTVSSVGHVDDVVVVRRVVDDGLDDLKRRRDARARAREALGDEKRAAQDELDLAAHAQRALEGALNIWSRAAARKLGKGDAGDDVDDDFDRFRAQLLAAADAVTAAQARVTRVEAKLQKIQLEDDRKEATRQRRVCDVVVRVSSTGGAARLVLTTLVPCAAWRPTHEARLQRAPTVGVERPGASPAAATGQVRFLTHGAVWNRTGEHWRGVKLVLSTARPALGAELPPLSADRLRLRQKSAEERKTIVVEHRVERVPPSATQGGAPGVDDGGEARVFTVAGADIPDDGRPHAVALSSFDAVCALSLVTMPERAPQVFLRASFKNTGRGPILAGPVTLVDAGAWVGTGDVLYTGPGDDLDLGFGSDDRLAARMSKKVLVDKKLVGKNIDHFVQEVTLTSTAPTPIAVLVILRLPVSELAQVKVLQSPQHGTDGELKLDTHGLARVTAVVEAGKERKVAVGFSFDAASDVVLPPPW